MENETDVIYIHPQKGIVSQERKYFYLSFTGAFFLFVGLVSGTPAANWSGLLIILTSPSNLLTDYSALGGFGSAFINAGILTLLSVLVAYRQKVILNGPLFASVLTVTGLSFFGKNLYSSISIILGIYLYAVFVSKPFSQYIMTGLFGSALSPVVSYITLGTRFPLLVRILLRNLAGIAIGLLLPPLAAQTSVFHRRFTLYNIGFTLDSITMTLTVVLRLFSYSIVENTLVSNEYHSLLVWIIFGFFLLTAGFGFYYNSFRLSGIREIFNSSGKLIIDFIANSGIGATLINVGLVGLMLSSYVLLVGDKLNGSVIGAILSAAGFSAFGCHLRNSFPILVGIFLVSLFGAFYEITSTGILVTAVFGAGLVPISGLYGSLYGVITGMLHIALVHNVSTLHGGLNLYNSSFSTGFVAGTLVPILDNFTIVRKEKKTFGKRITKKNHR